MRRGSESVAPESDAEHRTRGRQIPHASAFLSGLAVNPLVGLGLQTCQDLLAARVEVCPAGGEVTGSVGTHPYRGVRISERESLVVRVDRRNRSHPTRPIARGNTTGLQRRRLAYAYPCSRIHGLSARFGAGPPMPGAGASSLYRCLDGGSGTRGGRVGRIHAARRAPAARLPRTAGAAGGGRPPARRHCGQAAPAAGGRSDHRRGTDRPQRPREPLPGRLRVDLLRSHRGVDRVRVGVAGGDHGAGGDRLRDRSRDHLPSPPGRRQRLGGRSAGAAAGGGAGGPPDPVLLHRGHRKGPVRRLHGPGPFGGGACRWWPKSCSTWGCCGATSAR